MAVTQGWHGWSISGKNLQLSEIATILLIFGQTGTFLCDDYPLSISEVGLVWSYLCLSVKRITVDLILMTDNNLWLKLLINRYHILELMFSPPRAFNYAIKFPINTKGECKR